MGPRYYGNYRIMRRLSICLLVCALNACAGTAAKMNAAGGNFEEASMTIKRHYAYVGERQVHYRRVGNGPPIVMLHASPGSSWGLEGRMLQLARGHSVIAIDTPGYGESHGLGIEQPTIADYADAMPATLDAMGLFKVDLWGSHTGAAIALETAVRYPDRVRRTVLDGLPAYPPDERERYLKHYTPSLTPRDDGGHLLTMWSMRRDMALFSPWFDHTAAARRVADLPSPEKLHGNAVDFLRAGENYWQGYHAAFRYDALPAVAAVKVPTLVTVSAGDTLERHLSRMTDVSPQVRVEAPPADLNERTLEFLAGQPLNAAAAAPPPGRARDRITRDYVDTSVGQLLVRRTGPDSGRPLVLLHASPSSSKGMEPLMLALAGDRPVVTFDNPGNGDSAPLPGEPEIRDTAAVLLAAIRALGFTQYDLYGTHTGALAAMEVAIADPDGVQHLILDGITLFSKQQIADYLANYVQPLPVRWDGSHLIWAWNFLRDQSLFWPWYNRTAAGTRVGVDMRSPASLHASLVEFIKGGTTYHLNYRAAFAYPTRQRLPLLAVPTLICASDTDPLREGMDEARQLAPQAAVRVTPGRSTPEKARVTLDLYRRFMADAALPGAD
jgi:pimeloyl-ACP methyl ester carboxylesterase